MKKIIFFLDLTQNAQFAYNFIERNININYFIPQTDFDSVWRIKNHDPILQTEDRYIPPKTRGNILTEKYIKMMAEKPKRNPKKRIPLKNSMSSGLIVIAENKKKEGIKMNPKVRTNQDSTKSYEISKHMRTFKSKDNLKNFYLDNFNSVKENNLTRSKTNVSINFLIYNAIPLYRKDIFVDRKIIT